jgi:hypothetical protein
MGCAVRHVRAFLDVGDSLFHQYICSVLREILVHHFIVVSLLESNFKKFTVHQFSTMLRCPAIEELLAACVICATLSSKRALPVYNTLHIIAGHGDPTISSVAARMLERASLCLDSMIKSWCSKGEVDDPFSEFFIRCKESALICSNWWHDRYFIVDSLVPFSFTDDFVQQIFFSGKALNFIRNFDDPRELDMPLDLPLEQFVGIAAVESSSLILGLLRKGGLLENALSDIHRFVLLQRGDFAQDFIETKRLGCARDFAERDVPGVFFEAVSFGYDAKPPLSAVFGPYELRIYQAVSGMLFRLKGTLCFLLKIRRNNAAIQVVWSEVHAFVQLLYDYFHIQVILRSFLALRKAMKMKDLTFDKLRSEHTKHTSTLARGCWVSKSGRECRDALFRCLDAIEGMRDAKISLKKIQSEFRQELVKLRRALLNHQASGRAIVPLLQKCFANVLD